MSLDAALLELMADTVTIEPYVSQDANQAPTYGTAVTYRAQVLPATESMMGGPRGRETESMASVIVPGRLMIDHRARLTLPSGFTPRQPPIRKIEPMAGLGLDHTRIWF